MSNDLTSRLLKAKIELMTRSVFISTIALSVNQYITDKVETAQTNGVSIKYSPKYIENLSVTMLAGLMAHECWHIALQHLSRRGTRDPLIWNIAGDCIIDNMLVKAGFQVPDVIPFAHKYDDTWSTDGIYDDLIKQAAPKPPNHRLDIMGQLGEGEPKADDGSISGSPILDIIIRAHTQSVIAGKAAGEIPGELLREIDRLINPRIPWDVVLQRFLDRRVNEEFSWARRNRKHKVYLPSLYSYGLGHVTWAIDTSGSQDDDNLRSTLSEIAAVQQRYNPESMTIIDCDSRIHNVYEIDANKDILSLKFHGGGGTRFQPVLDYVAEHPTQALVYFTDLYGETDLEPVNYPLLWLCNSDHKPACIGETVYFD